MTNAAFRLLSVVILLLVLNFDASFAQGDVPEIQLRLARDTPAPGFVLMESSTAEAELHVSREAIVPDAQIEHVQAYVRDYGLVLSIALSAEGTRRVREATSGHVGGRTAVLIDSRVVSTGMIREPFAAPPREPFQVGLELPREEAKVIADRIALRWPERPLRF